MPFSSGWTWTRHPKSPLREGPLRGAAPLPVSQVRYRATFASGADWLNPGGKGRVEGEVPAQTGTLPVAGMGSALLGSYTRLFRLFCSGPGGAVDLTPRDARSRVRGKGIQMRSVVKYGCGRVRRGHRRDAADVAIAQLVPLVLDDAWTAVTAAAQLRRRPYDEVILRRARARVLSVSPGPASNVAKRAVVTLDLALDSGRASPEPLFAIAPSPHMDGRR